MAIHMAAVGAVGNWETGQPGNWVTGQLGFLPLVRRRLFVVRAKPSLDGGLRLWFGYA